VSSWPYLIITLCLRGFLSSFVPFMSKRIILNDINTILEMIKDQVQIIQSYEGKIPQIEMDIIMSNIRRLYDDFYELNKHNRQIKQDKSALAEHQEEEEQPQRELVTIISKSIEAQEVSFPEKIETTPPIEHVHPVKDLEKTETQEKPPLIEAVPVQEHIKKIEKKTVPKDLFAETENTTLADKYKDDKKTFHDKISGESNDKTFAETLQKSLTDLRTGIGVNDRFVFINELFGGSMSDYQAAIEEINKQADMEGAKQVIRQYQIVLGWKEDAEGLKKLIGFVQRRFR
jgi:hypothetical protein